MKRQSEHHEKAKELLKEMRTARAQDQRGQNQNRKPMDGTAGCHISLEAFTESAGLGKDRPCFDPGRVCAGSSAV